MDCWDLSGIHTRQKDPSETLGWPEGPEVTLRVDQRLKTKPWVFHGFSRRFSAARTAWLGNERWLRQLRSRIETMTILVQKTTTLLAKNNNFEFYIWYKIRTFRQHCHFSATFVKLSALAFARPRWPSWQPGPDSTVSFATQFIHFLLNLAI